MKTCQTKLTSNVHYDSVQFTTKNTPTNQSIQFSKNFSYTFFFKKAGNYMSYISRCQDENHFNF